jgi:hypothetical protein
MGASRDFAFSANASRQTLFRILIEGPFVFRDTIYLRAHTAEVNSAAIETENLFLFNPYPLSSSIHPSFQGIHSLTPLLQTFFHALNTPPVENAALHPGDMNEFIDLIDCPTDQTQGKGLHDEDFHFTGIKTTFVGDKTEFQGTAVRRPGEYEGKEGRGMDFLSEQS